jgi:hypothetical protein
MPVYAKFRGRSLVLPSSSPTGGQLGSLYVNAANLNSLTFRDYAGIDQPIFGTPSAEQVLVKRKKNNNLVTIDADTVVALLSDGSIAPADSDDPLATNAIGTAKETIAPNDYGGILILGPNSENVLDGMGFTTGDLIYLGSTPGSLTNDIGSIVGEIKVVGIADCPTDMMSSVATDLIQVSGTGSGGGGGSVSVEAAATLLQGYPVSIDATGKVNYINITDEDSAYSFVGVTSLACLIGGTANVLVSGAVLQAIPAAFGITGQYGKQVFVSHAGGLTVTKPEIGVGGFLSLDFIVSVGVTTKNISTGTTDLILNPIVRGRLA